MKILQSDSTDISTLLVLFYVKVCILELLISNNNLTEWSTVQGVIGLVISKF